MFDVEGLRNVFVALKNFGLDFFWPWTALIGGNDVQEGHGLTLVPPGHPEAAFEAVFEVV